MMEKSQGCHCKLLPGQRGTGGTAKGVSGGSTLLGFSSVQDTLFSAVPLAATAWKAPGLSVCFTRPCGTKQTRSHTAPPNTSKHACTPRGCLHQDLAMIYLWAME